MKYEYNTVVIGSGPGWLTVAIGLWVMGKKVCMIEKAHIGWDCTNYGCVPSKSLLHYARMHEGEKTPVVDAMNYARHHREEVREEETPEILASYGVETRFGFGSLKDKHTVVITKNDGSQETITTKRIVICTWSKARTVPVEGVADEDILTNEELFEMDYEIETLAILGDGVIACEMAEAFAGLWVAVTMISKHDEILDRYDPEVGTWMHQYLESKWVKILLNAQPVESKKKWELLVKAWEKEEIVLFDKLLMAIGRVPLIKGMNLEENWVKTDRWGIIVNTYGKTAVGNIYGVWDCLTKNPRMTHWSNHQWRHLVQNLIAGFGFANPSLKKHPLPGVLYTGVEVATVWVNEKQAIEKYGRENLVIRSHAFEKNDRSKLTDSTQGFMKVVAKRGTLRIVWVTIVGKNAGEMLPLYVYAVKHKISLWKLSSLIFAYPTRAEIIKWLIDEYLHDMSKDWKKELVWAIKRVFMFWKR